MLEQTSFLTELKQLMDSNNIISIYGKAGTGKTSLSIFLVGSYMTTDPPFYQQCVWIQASEFFPARRLTQLFHNDKDRLYYIRNNIFITPFKRPFLSYQEQSTYFIDTEHKIFPPDVKYIVIDNISHHLRFEVAKYQNVTDKIAFLNRYYETQLLPLILFTQRNNIIMILIHEVSYSPKLDMIVPFFHSLYQRVETIAIKLEKNIMTHQNYLYLSLAKNSIIVNYDILEDGFQFRL